MPDYRKELAFAKTTAAKAGAILRKGKGKQRHIDFKGRVDLVTEYDVKSEKFIKGEIARIFPRHSILAEESGQTDNRPSHVWVVDPLDGTTNFAHDYPAYCVSIGLEVEGENVLGVVYDPVHDEMFSAVKRQGAYMNRVQIHVSSQAKLSRSLVGTGFPYDIAESDEDNLDNFARMYKVAQGIRRGGSAALDLCYLACGRFDGFWELKLHPWDTAAGIVIVKEAGGKVTDFAGKKYSIYGKYILASNSKIHKQMQKVLLKKP
jgi:myo-inositol-1(or 4)-monophosphatase